MARPKKGEEKNRPCRLAFHVRKEIRDRVVKTAKSKGASMADIAEEAFELYFYEVDQHA